MSKRLHITNGDAAADVIRRAGIGGEILPWNDVLHDGLVPSGMALNKLSAVRAQFIAEIGWGDVGEVLADFETRDRCLRSFGDFDEVVLWFEHDLYDQLQLLQLLDFFAGEDLGGTTLTLICAAEFLGRSSPGRLAERFAGRETVHADQMEVGRRGWTAFRSSNPTAIAAFLDEDTAVLPLLASALTRHLEQFPSPTNGLSRSEQQILELIAAGHSVVKDLFRASQEREEAEFAGDASFAIWVQRLSDVPRPLVLFDDSTTIHAPRHPDFDLAFWKRRVKLTEAGQAVLRSDDDHIRLNGIDWWLGGVHLRPEILWRWNPVRRTIELDGE